MRPEEYAWLERVEGEHWFYRGKRAIARRWLERLGPLRADDLLIDGGCGTGLFLAEMSGRCRVLGIDSARESLERARPRIEAVGGRLLESGLTAVALSDGCAAAVTLLDVLEHLDDDRQALAEMARLTRPGGLVLVTVPALPSLWSDWDVTLGHRRRYLRGELVALAGTQELQLVHCAYVNSLAWPAIHAIRRWRRIAGVRGAGRRAEDRVPPHLLNRLLERTFVAPACWSWFHPPRGVSLLAVWRRRGVSEPELSAAP